MPLCMYTCLNQGLNCVVRTKHTTTKERDLTAYVIVLLVYFTQTAYVIVLLVYFTQTARFVYEPIFMHCLNLLGTKLSSCLSCASLKCKFV
jgi:hypothetical protein